MNTYRKTSTTVEKEPSCPYYPTLLQGVVLVLFTVAISVVVYLITVLTTSHPAAPAPAYSLSTCKIMTRNGWSYYQAWTCPHYA